MDKLFNNFKHFRKKKFVCIFECLSCLDILRPLNLNTSDCSSFSACYLFSSFKILFIPKTKIFFFSPFHFFFFTFSSLVHHIYHFIMLNSLNIFRKLQTILCKLSSFYYRFSSLPFFIWIIAH